MLAHEAVAGAVAWRDPVPIVGSKLVRRNSANFRA